MKTSPAPGLELRTVPDPTPLENDVVLQVRATSLCGTDNHIYRWDNWAQERIKPPRILGHEMFGEVVAVGKGVRSIRVGDRVAAESHVTCGKCFQCRTGNAHVCKDYSILGIDHDGSFAQFVRIPEQVCWKTDPAIPAELACLQEPMGNSVHAVLTENVAGHAMLVTGCGPTGLFSIAIARAAGASKIFATDISEYRLELARRVGADLAFDPQKTDPEIILEQTHGEGVDSALEMSGHPSAVHLAFKYVKNAGRVVLFGIPEKQVPLDLAKEIIFKGLRVEGITGRRLFDTWYRLGGLFRAGLNVKPIVTHTFPLDQFEKGFEMMHNGQCGKVVLIP